MTTIVVVRKGDTAVIAADSLTTFGTTRLAPAYDRHPEKITKYGDSYLGVAGSAAHQLVLENLLARAKDLDFHGKARDLRQLPEAAPDAEGRGVPQSQGGRGRSLRVEPDDGDDRQPHGIFAVYSMREVFEFDRFWAIGSGRDFALGAMYVLYDKAKAPAAVATAGVHAGAEFDTGTSEPVHLFEVKLRA
jgi:ATP-dependent protease HslVU (ClpYQ) peptidase subunit